MAKTPAQLDLDIAGALAESTPAVPGTTVPDRYRDIFERDRDRRKKAKAKRENAKARAKVYATPLNIFALGRLAHGRLEFPNAYRGGTGAHLRRCLTAGLVEVVSKKRLRLTAAGVAAIVDAIATRGEKLLVPADSYTDDVYE